MKKAIVLCLACAFIAGCAQKSDVDIKVGINENTTESTQSIDLRELSEKPILDEGKWGIKLWTEDVTENGLTIAFEQFGANPTGTLQTGDWYTIEVMNENSKWEKVPFLPHEHEVVWNSVAYIIKKNDRCEFEIDWEWLYGKLPEGHYRIGKEIMDYRAPGDFDKEIYYADFFVE